MTVAVVWAAVVAAAVRVDLAVDEEIGAAGGTIAIIRSPLNRIVPATRAGADEAVDVAGEEAQAPLLPRETKGGAGHPHDGVNRRYFGSGHGH